MSEKKTANPTQYKNAFAAEKYDRIPLQVPKGKREELRKVAESNGKSINAYIKSLIEKDSGLEL